MIFAAGGCIDPLDLPVPPVDYQLVVDGMITNRPGPYTVRLYRVRPLLRDIDKFVVERGATVKIFDNRGASETLSEVRDGVYETAVDGLRGEIGGKYHLEIKTQRGNSYYTLPDEIRPVGNVQDIRVEYEDGPVVDGVRKDRFKVVADASGVQDHVDLIRFRQVGTYQIRTSPHRHEKSLTAEIKVPDPLPCSGYVYDETQGGLVQVGECTCCDCWVTEKDGVPILYNENFTGMDVFNELEMGYVNITSFSFQFKYHLEVQQLSLTEDTYHYWNLVRSQKLGATDIFQPPVGELIGNVRSFDGSEPPMGIFWAAGISSKAIILERGDVPRSIPPPFEYKTDCSLLEYTTNRKPDFWP